MRFTILSALLLVALVVPNLHAQSNQLRQSQMAVVSFDIRMDKIRGSAMAAILDLENKMKQAAVNSDDFDPSDVNRIFGASSAPESMAAAQSYSGEGPLPVEAFVRIELKSSAAVEKMMGEIEKKSDPIEIGGQTYFKSNEEEAPENFLAHRVDETTIEVGTEAYLLRADRKVFTDGLTKAWKKVPDEAVRIAMDLEGTDKLMAELQEMATENGPPNFAAYYELIGAVSGLHITIDMDGPNLLTLGFTGKSESEAEEVEGGLSSLVGLAQVMSGGLVGSIKQQAPEVGGMVEEMVQALKVERADKSSDISLKLIHPEGFADAINGLMGN